MSEPEFDPTGNQSKVSSEHSPWQVSMLSKSLKDWIDKLGRVWVEGELAQINNRGGNLFAELRDLQTENTIAIHSWRGSGGEIATDLKQGDRVVALIKPQFWAKNGRLSMQLYEIKKVGLGEILERIERLRSQLNIEGLTDPANKKPLPFIPNVIGLITGAGSDAEKDVLENSRLRWPEVQFEVINTLVQGERAIPEIIFALEQLDKNPTVDVIIVARGGGSFQDLLIFSDESLVRAAAGLSKPLVSAIGHENDRPLLDDVSDLRASTPTDAAKRVVPDVVEQRLRISEFRNRLRLRVQSYLDSQQQLISSIRSRPIMADPYAFIDLATESLFEKRSLLRERFRYRLESSSSELRELVAKSNSLSPQLTLQRGYAVVTNISGELITSSKQTKQRQKLVIRVLHAEIAATVDEVRNIDG